MRRPRITIAGILGFVVFLAVGLAALREATAVWDSGVFGATLALLTASVLLAVHRRDRKRAFCLGFALFGWVYLGASLLPVVGSRLPTTMMLTYVASRLPGQEPASTTPILWPGSGDLGFPIAPQPVVADLTRTRMGSSNWAYTWNLAGAALPGTAPPENFLNIGHSLLALVVGLLGGVMSRRLYEGGLGDGVATGDRRGG